MKAFDDCCSVDKISSTQHAHEVRIELCDLYSGRAMHFVEKKTGKGRKTWTERQEKVKCNGKERPFGEELYAWLRWGGHIVFYANSATIRCGRFTVSNYLEHPINTNQSQWWSSMVGKNSKRRTRTAEILYLNCHLIKMRFEISHHLSLLKQRL